MSLILLQKKLTQAFLGNAYYGAEKKMAHVLKNRTTWVITCSWNNYQVD